jgi:hypothetical protein
MKGEDPKVISCFQLDLTLNLAQMSDDVVETCNSLLTE